MQLGRHGPHSLAKIWRKARVQEMPLEMPGKQVQDVVTDIRPISAQSKESTKYPARKPLALLNRIIRASSNIGDIILDPFCGCATALVAADRLDRHWVGIDLSPLTAKLVLKRLGEDRGPLSDDVIRRTDIPTLSDFWPHPGPTGHKHTLFGKQGDTQRMPDGVPVPQPHH